MAVTPETVFAYRRDSNPPSALDYAMLQRCIDVALQWVEDGARATYLPWVDNAPTGEPDFELGIMMLASWLYELGRSPTGIAGANDFGAVRVPSRRPAEIQRLLGRYMAFGIA
jgi:hypothetical protein